MRVRDQVTDSWSLVFQPVASMPCLAVHALLVTRGRDAVARFQREIYSHRRGDNFHHQDWHL